MTDLLARLSKWLECERRHREVHAYNVKCHENTSIERRQRYMHGFDQGVTATLEGTIRELERLLEDYGEVQYEQSEEKLPVG